MSTRRLAAFMVGLSSVWVAIGSPLAAFHHALLSVHMVQHVLLMAVAPPLMLIGAPALPLQYGLPWRSARRAVQRLLRSPPARSLRRFLTRPVVCWLAPVAALIGWHVPAVFELGVRSRWWHDLQAASFFATGVLFWLPVVRWRAGVVSASPWLIPVYLFAATLPCDALSAFLVFCDRVVYPSYPAALESCTSPRPGIRRRLDVGVGHADLSPAGRSDHDRAPVAPADGLDRTLRPRSRSWNTNTRPVEGAKPTSSGFTSTWIAR